MKSFTMWLLVAGALYSAPGHGAQDEVDAVGKWLNELTMRAALEDSSPAAPRRAELEGTYRVIPLSELDMPEEVKQHFRAEAARNRAGVKLVPGGEIPSEAEMIALLPRTVRSNAELRDRLPSSPSDLRGTILGVAELIGMEPSGALDGVKSTGLTRYFRLDGVGIVEFTEGNFRSPGTRIEAVAEMQNARVNGTPAQLERVADDQGRSRVTLSWAGQHKVYTLIATGEGDAQRKADLLQKIAVAVKD